MDFKTGKAIYLQIADYICEEILSGKLKQGDRIPSVRELSVKLEVNPNTVMRTYAFLQEKEIIVNQRGIGYFVEEKSYTKVLEFKKDEFVNLELPKLFNMMKLLNINFEELGGYYEKIK